jgi:hypothetical protein
MARLVKRAAELVDIARTRRNRAYFKWVGRATDEMIRATRPVLDLDVQALSEVEKRFYGRHLRVWLRGQGHTHRPNGEEL